MELFLQKKIVGGEKNIVGAGRAWFLEMKSRVGFRPGPALSGNLRLRHPEASRRKSLPGCVASATYPRGDARQARAEQEKRCRLRNRALLRAGDLAR